MDDLVLYYSGSKTDFLSEVDDNPLKVILSYKKRYANEPVDPPFSFVEFHKRLVQVMEKSFERNFGLQQYIENRKAIKCNPSIETLIEVECELEKQRIDGILIINHKFDPYQFLKLALERNYPFTLREQYFLGIFTSRSKITKLQKTQIGIQAAAQVLWFEKKEAISTIKEMREIIFNKNSILEKYSFLKFLNLLNPHTGEPVKLNERIVENYISKIFPIPQKERRGLREMNNSYFSKVIFIPGVFVSKPPGINFQKLKIVIIALTKILFFLGLSLVEIQNHPIFLAYKEPLKFYVKNYVDDWIKEGFHSDRIIFDL